MDDYFLSSKFLKLLLELLAEPERGIVNDFMGVALADVQGDNLSVLGIAVDESDVIEQTEVQLSVLQAFVEVLALASDRRSSGSG